MLPQVILLFETHATSVDNEAGIASGWADPPLSPRGEQQARELAVRRAEDDIVRAYSSDLTRAARTGEIALAGRQVPLVHDWRLRECHYGTLTRAPAAEIDTRRVAHLTEPFPDGESYLDVVQRVEAWLDEMLPARTAGGTLLVIGHRATYYALEHLLRGIPLSDAVAARWQWQPGWTYDLARRCT